jgi:dTDP-4-dehydrorhamnose reductase
MLKLSAGGMPARKFPSAIESWGGIECTVNRVGDGFRDQHTATGIAHHDAVFELLCGLGLDAVRFPILWEQVAPTQEAAPDWDWPDRGLAVLRSAGVRPIAGLIHHGSGPRHTSLTDPSFAPGLAEHAARVAERYPWITDWTPVNEPLTTARFSALYGIWYPHARDERLFWLALLNQVDATRLAMREIRAVQPAARLIQTDDLGRTYATIGNAEQAAFDNQRRWMSWDLLCGKVDPAHPLWDRLSAFGFGPRLNTILADPCPPDVIGINHYLTSDRLLDERIDIYPSGTRGGNQQRAFCDVEAVRVLDPGPQGLRGAIDEAWARYRRPIAITEVHNGCTREEQLRWLSEAWSIAENARERGVDLRAVTAWALFGSRDWDTLLTVAGSYEPGAYDVSAGSPRETALATAVRTRGGRVAAVEGAAWWRRNIRWSYPPTPCPAPMSAHRKNVTAKDRRPILITGATGTLGQALARECKLRDLAHIVTSRDELDLADPPSIARAIEHHRPWAVINAAGWVRVDEAEGDPDSCRSANATGSIALAQACSEAGIASVSFSSDLVFDGSSGEAYEELDPVNPLSVYGASKVEMEDAIDGIPGQHLVVRTAAFFSPHDRHNFAVHCTDSLSRGERFAAVSDCVVSPTYVPDLCRNVLDLLIDGETGIWHLTNGEAVSWFDFARQLADAAGLDASLIDAIPGRAAGWIALRPAVSALTSARGRPIPALNSAIARFVAGYSSAVSRSPQPALG